eukprot:7757943-Pyramimonas_sp.AAC.1
MVDVVWGIYNARKFIVQNGGATSSTWTQPAGIAHDRRLHVERSGKPSKAHVVTHDALYADDAMLAAIDAGTLRAHLSLVVEIWKHYGLEPNSYKTVLLWARRQTASRACAAAGGSKAH